MANKGKVPSEKPNAVINRGYKGKKVIEAWLLKNKWQPVFNTAFGSYVKRYFVLDLENQTLTYYSSSEKDSSSNVYHLNVNNFNNPIGNYMCC